MYLFMMPKNYNLFNDHPVLPRVKHDIHHTVEIIRKLGGRIYKLDLNTFAKISKLDHVTKLKILNKK